MHNSFSPDKIIPYSQQEITSQDIDYVINTLRSDFLTQGPTIKEFEQQFAAYVGAKYAVAVSNGTAALHLCALVLGVDRSTNVITSPNSFVASANCIRYCEGSVFLADIDPKTFVLDIQKVEQLILSKPDGFFKGIVPVDFAGYAVNLELYYELAQKYNLWILEDACHAPGGYFINKKNQKQYCGSGQLADLAVFSFHPVKHIACGEGGMITTNNESFYNKLLGLRTHGITKNVDQLTENHGGWYYEMQELGYNYRLTDIQAALGLSQLSRATINLEKRKEIAANYHKALKDIKQIELPYIDEGHALHLYVIRSSQRDKLYDFLRQNGIYAQVHYIPIHFQPYYHSLGFQKGDFPIAEKYYSECLSLPLYPSLKFEEQTYVIDMIQSFFY